MRRTILSFLLLLCVTYAASTTAYADDTKEYWLEQGVEAPESASPGPLCVSALALAALLVLRRRGAPRYDTTEFDSETLVLPRRGASGGLGRDSDGLATQLMPEVFSQRSHVLRRTVASARSGGKH